MNKRTRGRNRIRYPKRKWDCSSYSECLTQCARSDTLNMPCVECSRYKPEIIRHTLNDFTGCWFLALVVCKPCLYPDYLKFKENERGEKCS